MFENLTFVKLFYLIFMIFYLGVDFGKQIYVLFGADCGYTHLQLFFIIFMHLISFLLICYILSFIVDYFSEPGEKEIEAKGGYRWIGWSTLISTVIVMCIWMLGVNYLLARLEYSMCDEEYKGEINDPHEYASARLGGGIQLMTREIANKKDTEYLRKAAEGTYYINGDFLKLIQAYEPYNRGFEKKSIINLISETNKENRRDLAEKIYVDIVMFGRGHKNLHPDPGWYDRPTLDEKDLSPLQAAYDGLAFFAGGPGSTRGKTITFQSTGESVKDMRKMADWEAGTIPLPRLV